MIKEAMQWIADIANTKVTEVWGRPYSNGRLSVIEQATCSAITVASLSGLVEYVLSDFDWASDRSRLLLHVMSPTSVRLYTGLNNDRDRECLIEAEADLPKLRFGSFSDAEEFNIALQSMFVPNDDRAKMLQIVGNIKEENVANVGDDGTSQQVTAKTGVATVAAIKVPNPVVLAPYRTFVEVEQPESAFVFRMRSGPTCALFEADGGAWKNKAMSNVRTYLEDSLRENINVGHIVLIS